MRLKRPGKGETEYWSWWFVLGNVVVAFGIVGLLARLYGGFGVEQLDTSEVIFGVVFLTAGLGLLAGGIWYRSAAAAMFGIWFLAISLAMLAGIKQDHTNTVF